MKTFSRVRPGALFVLALFCLAALPTLTIAGDDAPLWLRHPALSPDGKTVAFDFRGDLYTVPAGGGLAVPVTLHEAHDMTPIWSPDGKWLAFASDRFGNWDIFIVAASGGQVRRLTFHSGADTHCSFTPDGKHVLFTATRLDAVKNAEFPQATGTVLPEWALRTSADLLLARTNGQDSHEVGSPVLVYCRLVETKVDPGTFPDTASLISTRLDSWGRTLWIK